MAKHLQLTRFLWLNATLLGFSLLLLLASPSWAQECNQAEIRSHIEQFKDNNLQQVARKVVVKCDTDAVVPLAEALSDRNSTMRAQAASALGTMGWTAREVVPDLMEALDDRDTLVRSNAAQSIGNIGRSAQLQARTLSELDLGTIQELDTLKQQLEQALSRLEKDKKDWTGNEANIPSFAIEELTKKAGLDPEEIQKAQQKRRVRMLINDLSAAELEYRARAAADLGQMGKAAKDAIPRLRKALEDESEVAKVRREVAKALKQLGEEIPMLIPEIKDGVESIHLVEHPLAEKIDLGNGVILEMVKIPGGTFLMGAPPEEEGSMDYERPQHSVIITPFVMGKYPVTQAQWQAVEALPMIERKLQPNPSYFKGEQRPVEQVSWYDAVEFCQRLSQHTGQDFRLPSEAEWEYACRAETTTPFHFGETISTDLAKYNGNHTYSSGVAGRSQTTPVGMFGVANAFGLYDMHGNVWEWCADSWHEDYQGAPADGSVWEDKNDSEEGKSENDHPNLVRLRRGGSWYDYPNDCRSASRNLYNAGIRVYYLGFRVVCGEPRTS